MARKKADEKVTGEVIEFVRDRRKQGYPDARIAVMASGRAKAFRDAVDRCLAEGPQIAQIDADKKARKKTAGRKEARKGAEKKTETAATEITESAEKGKGELNGVNITLINVSECVPTPDNPRVIDERSAGFKELAASVKGAGVLIPVHVRPLTKRQPQRTQRSQGTTAKKWELLVGARRVRASSIAGLERVPAIVHEGMTDAQAFELTFTENFQREDLTTIEEGIAAKKLLEKFNGDAKAVAAKLGKSEKWVRTHAKIADIVPAWKKMAARDERWSAAHLALVARLPEAVQRDAAKELQYGGVHNPVAWLEKRLNDLYVRALAKAPWDLEDATLGKKLPACLDCKCRSDRQGQMELFHADEPAAKKAALCLGAKCWAKKLEAHTTRTRKALEREHPNLVCICTDRHYDYSRQARLDKYKGWLGTDAFALVKKDEKGALPALIVEGAGVGTLRWIKKRSASSGSGTSGRAKGTPTPLKERRRALESKRWSVVLKELADIVDEFPLAKLPEAADLGLIGLAAVFGTNDRKVSAGDAEWTAYEAIAGPPAAAALWNQVRAVLARRLSLGGGVTVTQVPIYYQDEARNAAALCGIDLDPLYAKACETYPEPKTWKGLKADGTKKSPQITRMNADKKKKKKTGTTKGTKVILPKGICPNPECVSNKPKPRKKKKKTDNGGGHKEAQKGARKKMAKKGGKPNEHGVYTEGAETVKLDIPAKTKAHVKIQLAVDEDGKWRMGYDLGMIGGDGACGHLAAPCATGAVYDCREDALRAGLEHARNYFDAKMERETGKPAKRRSWPVLRAILDRLDMLGQCKREKTWAGRWVYWDGERLLFVADGISKGKSWATYHETSGSLRRLKSKALPCRPTPEEAQEDLNCYADDKEFERACRKCGCTDARGCPGGCSWVEDGLCSSCVEKG